jgi:hypothetical protein
MNMEYNSNREKLIIPEYGRNIQKLINHAKTIEDNEERRFFVEQVVNLMLQMQPQNKNNLELRDKLWKHVFRIGNYDLNIDPPEGVKIVPITERAHPPKLDYPQKDMKYRHYGSNVQTLIEKAKLMEEGPKRDMFCVVIATYMKMAYRNWNQDYIVTDEMIKQDLKSMSGGLLVLGAEVTLASVSTSHSGARRKKRSNGSSYNGKGKSRQKYRRKK